MTVMLAVDAAGSLERAEAAVEQGAVIGVPTDTVYGLVCLCSDGAAIDRLFAVKERPSHKPLPVLLGDAAQGQAVVRGTISPLAQMLMQRYWPGPLTIELPAQTHLPAALTAGEKLLNAPFSSRGATVGVRVPDQPFLRALAQRVGPLASSSANRSGASACATATEVLAQLDGRIPLLIDAGPTPLTQASTVLDLSGEEPKLLREGPIGRKVLAASGAVGQTVRRGMPSQKDHPNV